MALGPPPPALLASERFFAADHELWPGEWADPPRPWGSSAVVELLSDYLEDALAADKRARVDAHLATCPDCTAYVAQLHTTIGLLGRLREDDVPQPVLDELAQAFRGWQEG